MWESKGWGSAHRTNFCEVPGGEEGGEGVKRGGATWEGGAIMMKGHLLGHDYIST